MKKMACIALILASGCRGYSARVCGLNITGKSPRAVGRAVEATLQVVGSEPEQCTVLHGWNMDLRTDAQADFLEGSGKRGHTSHTKKHMWALEFDDEAVMHEVKHAVELELTGQSGHKEEL